MQQLLGINQLIQSLDAKNKQGPLPTYLPSCTYIHPFCSLFQQGNFGKEYSLTNYISSHLVSSLRASEEAPLAKHPVSIHILESKIEIEVY